MRLWALVAAALLSTLVLAGCSDSGDGDESATSTSSTSTTSTSTSATSTTSGAPPSSSSSSTSSAPAANQPPTGSLSAVVNGTAATFTVDGTDADGDALSWNLAFGDGASSDGTALPSTVQHNYTAAGNFSVVLTLTDGTDPVTYNVTVAAVAGGGAGALQTVSLSWQVGTSDVFAPTEFILCTDGPGKGVTHETFNADPATFGKTFTATITDASDGASIQDWSILFNASDCATFEAFDGTGPAVITGTVPANMPYVLLISTGGVMPSVTYTAG